MRVVAEYLKVPGLFSVLLSHKARQDQTKKVSLDSDFLFRQTVLAYPASPPVMQAKFLSSNIFVWIRPVLNVVLLPCRTQMNLARQRHDDSTAAVSNVEPNTVAPNSKQECQKNVLTVNAIFYIQICISWTYSRADLRWMWKSTSSYSTRYYRSHLLHHWHVALPVRFSVPSFRFFFLELHTSPCSLTPVTYSLESVSLSPGE